MSGWTTWSVERVEGSATSTCKRLRGGEGGEHRRLGINSVPYIVNASFADIGRVGARLRSATQNRSMSTVLGQENPRTKASKGTNSVGIL